MRIVVCAMLGLACWGQPLPPPPRPVEAPMSVQPTGRTQLYAQITTYGAVAALDYHSTQRGLSNGAGREANPLLSCGGQLCTGRFVALNVAVGAGAALVGRFVVPALPPTPRKIVNGLIWAMLGGRAAVVARNYAVGGRR